MKKKSILFTFIFSTFILILCVYFSYLYVFPLVVNSVKVNSYVEKLIYDKTGLKLSTSKLKLKTHKNLSAYLLIKNIYLAEDNKKILNADNLKIYFNPVKKQLNKIEVDYLYIDKQGITKLSAEKKQQNNIKFDFNNLPYIEIKKSELNVDNEKITIENIKTQKDEINNLTEITLNLGNIGDSKLEVTGKTVNNQYEFKIKGQDIPVRDTELFILNFLKLKNPNKNFLENFYDFSGSYDIDLTVKKVDITGKCLMKKLHAKTVKYNIPIDLKDFIVFFDGNEINAQADGLFGGEYINTVFNLTDYNPENRVIKGFVNTTLTNSFTKKYISDITIDGSVNAGMSYFIKDKIPKITYLLKIKQGANLTYKKASLGLTDKNRRLYVRTEKNSDKLYIKSFDYSTQNGKEIDKILTGDGLIEKTNGKLEPKYITCKTKEFAPLSVTGSFGEKLDGGFFNGDLKYDFDKKILTGEFILTDSRYKDFLVKEASIKADEIIMDINAKGKYLNSDFESNINMLNRYSSDIVINNIYLFLDKYTIKNNYRKHKKRKNINSKLKEAAEEINLTVKQGLIKINEVSKDKIKIENIEIFGNLKNDIVDFTIPQAQFANGNLKAKGKYNISNHSSNVEFWANNIDSDRVAYMVFNLKDEIAGIANAHLTAQTKDNLKYVNAKADFSIKGGYLPKLGSTQFIIKRSKKTDRPLKIRISNIINIDISQSKALSSDINGSFVILNKKLDDIKLFSKQKFLSIFIEGDYDIKREDAKLEIWGNYNKTAQKKVKILFIPLSFIMKIIFKQENTKYLYMDKIKQIPPISATEDETETFRVKINGNLNNNNVKVELKSLQ